MYRQVRTALMVAGAACILVFNHALALASRTELLDMSLAELMDIPISTASKARESQQEAPGITSVITANEIERFGANNLYELLERVTGTYQPMTYMYPHNVVSFRGDLRGGLDTHILLLLNGRPFRDSVAGGLNYSIYNAFPLSAIEKIEIIRGPGSVLYGTNAFSGVINIITKKAGELESGETRGQVSVGGGSFGAGITDSHVGYRQGKFSLTGGFKLFHEDGWDFHARDEHNEPGNMNMNEHNLGGYLQARYADLSLEFAVLQSRQNFFNGVPIWALQPDQNDTRRILADLGYSHTFSKHWHIQTNLTYNGRDTQFSDLTNAVDEALDEWLLEVTNYWQRDKLSFLVGGTFSHASGHTDMWLKQAQTLLNAVPDFHTQGYTLYGQGSYQASNALKLFVGGQAVKSEGLDWNFVPRVGAIYQFTSQFGLKGLFSQAYRSPSRLEYFVESPVILGNPDLGPETVDTYDIQFFHQEEKYQWALTYFNSHQKDLIVQVFDPDLRLPRFENAEELHLRGWELETRIKPSSKLALFGSATYQENHREDGVENYTAVPTWSVKVGVSYDFADYFSMGLYDNYFSAGHDVSGRGGNALAYNPPADPVHIMSLNLNLDIGRWTGVDKEDTLLLNGYVYNLLDEEVYSPEIIRGELATLPARQGRGTYLNLRYYF